MGNAIILGPLAESSSLLPFFSERVPAGFPSPAQDHLDQKISLDDLLNINAPQTFLAEAGGDSMNGIGMFDKDVLIVDRSITAVNRSIVIAVINGDSFVKRFCREGDAVVLRSENPAYPPRFVMEGDELYVWGVVTAWVRRPLHA